MLNESELLLQAALTLAFQIRWNEVCKGERRFICYSEMK